MEDLQEVLRLAMEKAEIKQELVYVYFRPYKQKWCLTDEKPAYYSLRVYPDGTVNTACPGRNMSPRTKL